MCIDYLHKYNLITIFASKHNTLSWKQNIITMLTTLFVDSVEH